MTPKIVTSFIGGKWVEPNESSHKIKIIHPADEQHISTLYEAGANEVSNAAETAKKTFAGGSGDELPVIKIKKDQINNGLNIIDLSIKTNLFSSKSEIRRTIKNSGLKVNNSTVTDENLVINVSDFKDEVLKISHGKKNHVLIKIIG